MNRLIYLSMALLLGGCSVFRQTAVDQHVAVSRDLTLQGLSASSSNNPQEAERWFDRAVQSDPKNVEARILLARTYQGRGKIPSAIQQLEESLRIDPENVEVLFRLGECYSATNQTERALELSERALRKNRESVEAWALKARTLWQMGSREQALADYQRALRIEPQNNELRGQMAVLYQELDKPLRALTTLDRIAADFDEEKTPEEILVRQSASLQELARHREAADRLAVGFQRGDYSEDLAARYVTALLDAGDSDHAAQALLTARNRFPNGQRLVQLQTRFSAPVRQNLIR